MRAHVSDRSGLAGCSCGSGRRRSARVTCSATSNETTPDPFSDIKLATRKRARPSDGIARAAVVWDFGLEQGQHAFRAVRRPYSDDSTLGVAQCLWRPHPESLSGLTIPSMSATPTARTTPSATYERSACAGIARLLRHERDHQDIGGAGASSVAHPIVRSEFAGRSLCRNAIVRKRRSPGIRRQRWRMPRKRKAGSPSAPPLRRRSVKAGLALDRGRVHRGRRGEDASMSGLRIPATSRGSL